MSQALQQLVQRIESYLNDFVTHYERQDDIFRIHYESTAVLVIPIPLNEDHTLVRIAALVLRDIDETPELWQTIARINREYLIGKLCYWPEDRTLLYEYFMLGDYLDREEFYNGFAMVALTADNLDDELQKKLGGKRFIDP